MRASARLLATAASMHNGSALALLPPIPLYRRLLRAHRRHLTSEMRLLGDEYIKAEFRAHRNVDNPVHIKVEGDSWKGEKIDPAKMDKMSDQQIGQLHELMKAITNRHDKTGEAEE